ncbi:MAG: DUF4402 domain-containing protein [Sphingomicrobium sp.]
MTIIKKLALACSVAAIGFAAPAQADPYTAPSANGTATVRLFSAIDLQKVQDIDFGTIIRSSGASGSVFMSSVGAIDCTAVVGVTCTGAPTEGHFTINGDSGSAMSVTVSGATFDATDNTLLLSNGTETVSLALEYAGMTQDVLLGVNQSTFGVTGAGSDTDIKLFGTLTFGDSTVAPNGVYTASFNLTADYD